MAKKAPPAKKRVAPIAITRGETVERVIFRGSRKALDRRELQVALEPILRAWIGAACTWNSVAIGDYRFLIFALDVAPETEVYVQFWSEPVEPVIWEVSSGPWNPLVADGLAGDRAARIQAMGFSITGSGENYSREVQVTSPADVAALAKDVVHIFYHAFDYRGTAPIVAKLGHEGRSKTDHTFDAMTPEDVSKVFASLGFRVQWPQDAGDGGPVVIRCRKKRGAYTEVQFMDQVPGQNLYRRLRFEAEVEMPPEERERMLQDPAAPDGGQPFASISVVQPLSGGVTIAWLADRIREWDEVLALHRRMSRAAKRTPKPSVGDITVH